MPVVARTPLERDLQRDLICMCGTCGRQLLSECQCSYAQKMRVELARLVAEGRTREQIVGYYIDKYGSQEPLAQPLDRGFNRLAWAVPYALGATGLIVTGLVAMRWARRGAAAPAPDAAARNQTVDPALERRLTMSSATLTDAARESRPARRPVSPPAAPGGGTAGEQHPPVALLPARVNGARYRAIVLMRGQPPERMILAALTVAAAGYAGYACFARSTRSSAREPAKTRRWWPDGRGPRSSATRCSRCARSRTWSSIARWGRSPRATSR